MVCSHTYKKHDGDRLTDVDAYRPNVSIDAECYDYGKHYQEELHVERLLRYRKKVAMPMMSMMLTMTVLWMLYIMCASLS